MKCKVCKTEITYGVNGCMFQGNICNSCNGGASRFDLAPPRQATYDSDYEQAILSRQEERED